MIRPTPKAFADLLRDAVHEPGILSQAYRQFHSYSLGNQLLAMVQCHERAIEPGPMATYPKWKELGRQVRKGEKALTLCMPVTVKLQDRALSDADSADDADSGAATFTRFVYKARWFVLSQTEGEPVPEPEIPSWDADRALAALDVEQIPFEVHRRELPRLRPGSVGRDQPGQSLAAQDQIPRAGACAARPYRRRAAG